MEELVGMHNMQDPKGETCTFNKRVQKSELIPAEHTGIGVSSMSPLSPVPAACVCMADRPETPDSGICTNRFGTSINHHDTTRHLLQSNVAWRQ
jgi:hypothetical protein